MKIRPLLFLAGLSSVMLLPGCSSVRNKPAPPPPSSYVGRLDPGLRLKPAFLECREGLLYSVPVAEARPRFAEWVHDLTRAADGDPGRVMAGLAEGGPEVSGYTLCARPGKGRPEYLLDLWAGAPGFAPDSLEFVALLDELDVKDDCLHFFVRDDAILAYQAARDLAWLKGLRTSVELMPADGPVPLPTYSRIPVRGLLPLVDQGRKRPRFVDVYAEHLVLYPSGVRVTPNDIGGGSDPLGLWLAHLVQHASTEYPFILVRPGAAGAGRAFEQLMERQGLSTLQDLLTLDQPVPAEAMGE